MKILQITPAYKPALIYGGPTVSVALLCEQLKINGTSINVFTTTANGSSELNVKTGMEQSVDGVPVTYFKRITKDHTHFSPGLLRALRKNIKNYDIVHVHGWWNTVSMLSAWIAIRRNVPLLVSPRGMLSSYSFGNKNIGKKRLLHQLFGKRLLTKSFIHSTAGNESLAVKELVETKGIIEVPNFVKLDDRKRPAVDKTIDRLEMVFFSRIEEKKGLDILLNALRGISIPFHLTIAGDGEQAYVDSLKAIAEKNGLSDRMTWAGFQTGDKYEYLSSFDVMILPSYDENFGNAVIESLYAGTAVLISENVGLSDYVAENDLGWVCRLDEDTLHETIMLVCEQKDKLARIRTIAPGKVSEDFNTEAITQRYLSLYRSVING